jgi:uncharacterized protein (UPF0147 family)
MDALAQVIDVLKELQEDNSVSKNIKGKVAVMQRELENCKKEELSLKINKILCDLEDISNDVNLPMFVRTQIYQLTSMLETVC